MKHPQAAAVTPGTAGEVILTTVSGRRISIRASDIFAVEDGLAQPRDPVYQGERCTIFYPGGSMVIRDPSATVKTQINAATTGTAATAVPSASTTVEGILEIATQAEVDAGTDSDRAVTPATLASYSLLRAPYAILEDRKTSGTQGGTFETGARRTRVINTEVVDADGIVSIGSNQFTLQAGTYRVRAQAPAMNVQEHQIFLENVTDGTTTKAGTSEYTGSLVTTHSFLDATFTIAAAKAFEIQQECSATQITYGFGTSGNWGIYEVFTIVYIEKDS